MSGTPLALKRLEEENLGPAWKTPTGGRRRRTSSPAKLSARNIDQLSASEGYKSFKPAAGGSRKVTRPWWSPTAYMKVGAHLTWIESLLCFLLPLPFLLSSMRDWFLWNTACQLTLFLPVVIVPALTTGHLAYVDIGWPAGLVVIAVNCFFGGSGYWLRKWAVSGIMAFHGGRMLFGGLVMFYPYKWAADLPRYRYAGADPPAQPPTHCSPRAPCRRQVREAAVGGGRDAIQLLAPQDVRHTESNWILARLPAPPPPPLALGTALPLATANPSR